MIESPNLARAQQLLSQSRGKEAEQYARQAVAEDAENPLAYLVLSWTLREQRRYQEALAPAQEALARAPNAAACHYNLAVLQYSLERWSQAEECLQAALEIDPDDADSYALLAFLAGREARWERMLDLAEMGLRIDSDHVGCGNARAQALTKLKRSDEAIGSLDYALQRDPENPQTHFQKANVLLERGAYDEAAHHFCEALRLDPDMQAAKEGLVEALKGRHWIYSAFLKYVFFMSRLEPRSRWGVLLGGYFAQRILYNMLYHAGHPGMATGVRILYAAVVYFTWTASSLFNLLLLVHPLGRHALSPKQKAVSAGVAGALVLAAGNAVAHFWLQNEQALLPALAFLTSTLPISALESIERPSRIRVALAATGLQVAAAVASVPLYLLGFEEASQACALAAIVVAIAFSWIAAFAR